MNTPPERLLDRALSVIQREFGYTRERALEWLNNDKEDWTPPSEDETQIPPGWLIQTQRRTEIPAAYLTLESVADAEGMWRCRCQQFIPDSWLLKDRAILLQFSESGKSKTTIARLVSWKRLGETDLLLSLKCPDEIKIPAVLMLGAIEALFIQPEPAAPPCLSTN